MGFFPIFYCYLGLSFRQNSLILCYSMITINCPIIPPLVLIDPHSTYSTNNFNLVILGFPNSDLLQIWVISFAM